jgi:hypothetical protein
MSGTLPQTRFLDTAGTGHWSDVLMHVFPRTRDYGSSVMYAEGKILVMGGSDPPTASAEVIDLNVADPAWKDVEPMPTPGPGVLGPRVS